MKRYLKRYLMRFTLGPGVGEAPVYVSGDAPSSGCPCSSWELWNVDLDSCMTRTHLQPFYLPASHSNSKIQPSHLITFMVSLLTSPVLKHLGAIMSQLGNVTDSLQNSKHASQLGYDRYCVLHCLINSDLFPGSPGAGTLRLRYGALVSVQVPLLSWWQRCLSAYVLTWPFPQLRAPAVPSVTARTSVRLD